MDVDGTEPEAARSLSSLSSSEAVSRDCGNEAFRSVRMIPRKIFGEA